MPRIRDDPNWRRRYLWTNAVVVASLLPFFVYAIWRESWIACVLFGLGALLGFWNQKRRESRFRCPECGDLIVGPADDPGPGDPIDFVCERCDIRWKTGATVDDS
ncbi:MAG: hypothetical protein WD069_07625 [Planctomycetales bacterium]